MRHLKAGDDHACPLRVEGSAHRPADALRYVHHPAEQCRIDVLPVVHLSAGYDEGVALGHGFDGEERDDAVVAEVVFVDEAPR